MLVAALISACDGGGVLALEQTGLALPAQLLRALPEEYIDSLPDEVQREVRARLAATDAARSAER
ncbi:MAG: hypothetical protein Tsb0020_52700 [Haliangiales bacterium]